MLEFKELWADPATQTVVWTFVGVLLAKFIYPLLQKLVKKTETMADDQFLEAIENIVNDALKKKTTKK